MELSEIMERCRELHGPWLAERGEDVQLSLLTPEEIHGRVEPMDRVDRQTGDSSPNWPELCIDQERDTLSTLQLLRETNFMLPPITNADPGDETDAED